MSKQNKPPKPEPVFAYRSTVPKDAPLFVGMIRTFAGKGVYPPSMCIVSWCPCCHKRHNFLWRGDIIQTPDAALHQQSRCVRGPWIGQMVYVALNPGPPAMERNAERYARWKVSLELWEARKEAVPAL